MGIILCLGTWLVFSALSARLACRDWGVMLVLVVAMAWLVSEFMEPSE